MPEDFLSLENTDSDNLTTLSDQPDSGREGIKHLLIGSPIVVKRTIQALHSVGYAEFREWSKLQNAGSLGQSSEVISILLRYVLPE